MPYHLSLITADGAYHCPVGSIMAIFLVWSGQDVRQRVSTLSNLIRILRSWVALQNAELMLRRVEFTNGSWSNYQTTVGKVAPPIWSTMSTRVGRPGQFVRRISFASEDIVLGGLDISTSNLPPDLSFHDIINATYVHCTTAMVKILQSLLR